MGSSCSCRKKKSDPDEVIPILNGNVNKENPNHDKFENTDTKLIFVKSNENSESLPIKKRYKYEVEDLQDILNGQTYLLKTPSKTPLKTPKKQLHIDLDNKTRASALKTPSKILNNDNNNGLKKSSLTRVTEDIIYSPYGRSRSYSPGRESKNSENFGKTPKRRSKKKKSRSETRNLKNSVSFEQNNFDDNEVESPRKISADKGEMLDRSNLRHEDNYLKNSNKNISKQKKNRNESLISNPETNPMNPINDKDLNILETIKHYLDSVKQNNYNETREHSIQVDIHISLYLPIKISSCQAYKSCNEMNVRDLYFQIPS